MIMLVMDLISDMRWDCFMLLFYLLVSSLVVRVCSVCVVIRGIMLLL